MDLTGPTTEFQVCRSAESASKHFRYHPRWRYAQVNIPQALKVFCLLISAVILICLAGHTNTLHAQTAPETAGSKYAYKGIAIGLTADEVRKKLGDPKDKSDPQDLYVFSDDESAQFLYGPDKKVTAIMVTFSGKLNGAPSAKDVFGEDVPPKPDGGVFKMVRYPKAGFWISYNKIVGDDSMVSIAMQKM